MKPLFHCTMFVKVENVNMCGIVQQYFTFGLQDYNHIDQFGVLVSIVYRWTSNVVLS